MKTEQEIIKELLEENKLQKQEINRLELELSEALDTIEDLQNL